MNAADLALARRADCQSSERPEGVQGDGVDRVILERVCEQLLIAVGEDPEREGLVKTPDRFARAMEELTVGYRLTVAEVVGDAIFHEDYSEMVIVQGIEFHSLCEHHLLPFYGVAHVGYIPDGKIIGLSKIPRIVDLFARRLQVQERLTNQVADALEEVLNPKGIVCLLEGTHMCMSMRGVEKQMSSMVTTSTRGVLKHDVHLKQEFLNRVTGSLRT